MQNILKKNIKTALKYFPFFFSPINANDFWVFRSRAQTKTANASQPKRRRKIITKKTTTIKAPTN